MPDEQATAEDELLSALLDDEQEEEFAEEAEEAEQRYVKGDEKLARDVRQVKEYIQKSERQKQADKMYQEFMATASDTAKEIYAVLADDDMTPAQMKKVIDAAGRKAQAIDEKASPEKVEEAVEARVNEELASRWGVGPIKGAGGNSPEDRQKELMERIAKGDLQAYIEATFSPPPLPR